MKCCIENIFKKNVVSIETGSCIGFISDVEVDTCTGQILRLFISEYDKLITFKKQENIVICWDNIAVIGEDTILVKNVPAGNCKNNHQKGILKLFSK